MCVLNVIEHGRVLILRISTAPRWDPASRLGKEPCLSGDRRRTACIRTTSDAHRKCRVPAPLLRPRRPSRSAKPGALRPARLCGCAGEHCAPLVWAAPCGRYRGVQRPPDHPRPLASLARVRLTADRRGRALGRRRRAAHTAHAPRPPRPAAAPSPPGEAASAEPGFTRSASADAPLSRKVGSVGTDARAPR